MLEQLIELLLNAKGGVIAGLFLVGTTGALITATVTNGVTTITVTPSASASPSGSASASPSASPTSTASPAASPSPSPSSSPSSSAKAASCESQSHAIDKAVDQVNDAFEKDHETLMHLRERARTDKQRDDLKAADTLLKQIRRDAVKAIHATRTCADDEDEQGEDKDNDKDDHHASASPSATPSASPTASGSPLVSGGDPKTIADNAVAAMNLVVKTVLADFPTPTASPSRHPERSHSPEPHETGHDD